MQLEDQAIEFLNQLTNHLESKNIVLNNWEVDHICYRTSSLEGYEKAKSLFESLGECLVESDVNGRAIATYKLEKPIFYKKWIIDLVEVPAPKPGKITKEGFEHIEVVIDEGFDNFMKKYPAIAFETNGLKKDINQELEIEFENCAIKFHHKSLEHIINIEKNKKVQEFLNESQVLTKFKSYHPCISGTIPLNIHSKQSDLDILFSSDDFSSFQKDVESTFKEYKKFEMRRKVHQGLESLVINFEYLNLAVEFFCQSKEVFKQQANQHFLIEGRLLKILGKSFHQQIRDLKSQGVKTEPAFGKLLKLQEPYSELIELNKLSDAELLNKFMFIS